MKSNSQTSPTPRRTSEFGKRSNRDFVLELRKWQSIRLDSKERGLFPSPMTGRPYHADSIRADYLVPTGLQLGLGRIEFHTFRHTYRAWLDETELQWAYSRSSCETRTFLQRWTSMEVPRLWRSARPIGQ